MSLFVRIATRVTRSTKQLTHSLNFISTQLSSIFPSLDWHAIRGTSVDLLRSCSIARGYLWVVLSLPTSIGHAYLFHCMHTSCWPDTDISAYMYSALEVSFNSSSSCHTREYGRSKYHRRNSEIPLLAQSKTLFPHKQVFILSHYTPSIPLPSCPVASMFNVIKTWRPSGRRGKAPTQSSEAYSIPSRGRGEAKDDERKEGWVSVDQTREETQEYIRSLSESLDSHRLMRTSSASEISQ